MASIRLGGNCGKSPVRGFALIDEEDIELAGRGWWLNGGYAKRKVGRNAEMMHRVVMARKLGRALAAGEYVDHINHDKLDNRRANLRVVDRCGNSQNRRGAPKHNTSGYRGVHRIANRPKCWHATVSFRGKRHFCGVFYTAAEAGAAAARMRIELGCLSSEQ